MQKLLLQFFFCVLLSVSFAATGVAGEFKTPTELKNDIVKLMSADVDEDTIAQHIRQSKLTTPLSTDDILEWKSAGISKNIIQAALVKPTEKPLEDSLVIPFSEDLVPLDITINPLQFLTVIAEKGTPLGRRQPVYFKVRSTNIGKKDYFGIVKVSLLDGAGNVISVGTKKRSIEKGQKKKPINVRFRDITHEQYASIAAYRLDLSVLRD